MNPEIGRPLAAVLILALLLLLLCFAPGAALTAFWAAQGELDAKSDLATQMARHNLKLPRQGDAPPVAGTPFIVADSDALAAAQIDTSVRSIANEVGASVLLTQPEVIPEKTEFGTRVQVKVVLEGGNDAIQASLFRLEKGSPVLIVDAFELSPVESSAEADAQNPRLHAAVTLSGYWNPSAHAATH